MGYRTMEMEAELPRNSREMRALAILSILLNVLLIIFTVTVWHDYSRLQDDYLKLQESIELFSEQNEELAKQVRTLSDELNMTRSQLEYYKRQAEDYWSLLRREEAARGLVGKAVINVVAVKAEYTLFEVHYEGITLYCEVELREVEGEGRVLVNTKPKIGIDLQTSARTAVLVAEKLTGTSLQKTDVIVTVRAEESVKEPIEVIDGPSAGAAITIATIAAIRNETLSDTVFITGTINPDGTIGKVGGIPKKAEAAALRGGRTFLVPEDQGTVITWEPIKREIVPGLVLIEYKTRLVNLEDYLRERGYDIDVMEIRTVSEAYGYFTGKGL